MSDSREKNYEDLVEKYPKLYADRHASMRATCMCWGFSCGTGWYDIIDKLSAKLEYLINVWIGENPDHADHHPRASQVKEKWGTLSFYMTSGTDIMYDVISMAEWRSGRTCEICGEDGRPNKRGWITTLCHKCRRESYGRMYKIGFGRL